MEAPKTADQINLPQTGKAYGFRHTTSLNPKVPHPPKLVPPEAAVEEKPAGWWNLCDLQGSLDGVIKAIDEAPDVPIDAKLFLQSDIRARVASGDFNFVHLDAHYHIHNGRGVLHYDCKPSKKRL